MQGRLDVALRLSYMDTELHRVLDERYEQVIAQLITMMNQADKWCRS